jgi:hypothetical protein
VLRFLSYDSIGSSLLQRSKNSEESLQGKRSEEIKRNRRISEDRLKKQRDIMVKRGSEEPEEQRQIRLEQQKKNQKEKERRNRRAEGN